MNDVKREASAPPVVATVIGDPCGIGPEIVVKALAADTIPSRPLLIGDAWTVEQAIALTRAPLGLHVIDDIKNARFASGVIDVLDPKNLKRADITVGQVSAACGRAVTQWLELAGELARRGEIAAIIKAPVNAQAIRLGGGAAGSGVEAGKTYLFLLTGPLRVAHLTDHIPLRQVLKEITRDNILKLLRLLHASLTHWGLREARIGVAGLNPHAEGEEDREEILPAVMQAKAEGIHATGPVPPDSLFRQCVEGDYDCVVAHYHDQGHIAVKTWGFRGNCALILGAPSLRVSVAHGTAFDIAGRGVADAASMLAAMKTAAALAASRGFPKLEAKPQTNAPA